MKIDRPRTFLELQVGERRTCEVVIHVRRSEIDWFNDNDVFDDLLELLTTSILPRQFDSEIDPESVELGPGGVPLIHKTVPKKRKRKRPTKKELAEIRKQQKEEERKARNSQKDICYAYNDTVRIAYRTTMTESGCVLKYNDNKKNQLMELEKLPKRIVAWCYPASVTLPSAEGFFRPEMIPLASLFRSSKDTNRVEDAQEVVEIDD